MQNAYSTSHILQATEEWVKAFVIQKQLCPFAKLPQSKGQIHYQYAAVREEKEFLEVFWKLIQKMMQSKEEDYISNSILIVHPENTFEDILDFSSVACEFLLEAQLHSHFQIVEFHPELYFDGVEKNDVSNFVNRSPYPFIHILRVEEVAEAVASYPEIDDLPAKNIEKMKAMGFEALTDFVASFQKQ